MTTKVHHVDAALYGKSARFRLSRQKLDVFELTGDSAVKIFDQILRREWRMTDVRRVIEMAHPGWPIPNNDVKRYLADSLPVEAAGLAALILEAALLGLAPEAAKFDTAAMEVAA